MKCEACGRDISGTAMWCDECAAAYAAISHKCVEHDASGVGHAWWPARETLSWDIAREIASEIEDGGVQSCDDFVASNGLHYRW